MNNNFYLAIFAVSVASSIILMNAAHATVGGPTLVYDLKFDPKTNYVYYTEQNYGGKGCPPELKAISLDTNVSKVVYSCDDGLNQDGYEPQKQQEKINSFTSTFTTLNPINLRKNNVTVSVDLVESETFSDPSNVIRTNFVANIFQDKVKKISIPFSGCSANQPLVVEGYNIPGVQDKIVLLFSRKGDCFESGYIFESVHLISGAKMLDGSQIYERKTNSPLVPHEGSLVVYAEKTETDNLPSSELTLEPSSQVKTTEDTLEGYSVVTLVVSSALALLLGVLLGRWKHKESVTVISDKL